ncbi:tautomerase family protein [Paraburkholderia phytofirmans]|uniref:4-oxalocrotonate tautomerase n=1 Tax=Paraburkholderia phytofirmans OLGA172 TaxID=1417228 RepID=A0A160FTB1_9BURK|nr:tautomerase family protein [Paraburkholderia phytofirmans]ANB75908.1 4-oxalocrotonate tautomerase [Paraburkholderia phytofirmans OLGA172]
MPTYLVSAAAGRLDAAAKQQIAFGITQSHSTATGAQGFFAQVIFDDVPAGNHFIGGKPLRSDQIFVHGYIRAGRTADQKQQLFNDIVRVVQEGANVESRFVWAYISELPPAQMVEYGKVLPEPGGEGEWLNAMSDEDRDYLLSIG